MDVAIRMSVVMQHTCSYKGVCSQCSIHVALRMSVDCSQCSIHVAFRVCVVNCFKGVCSQLITMPLPDVCSQLPSNTRRIFSHLSFPVSQLSCHIWFTFYSLHLFVQLLTYSVYRPCEEWTRSLHESSKLWEFSPNNWSWYSRYITLNSGFDATGFDFCNLS